MLYQSSDSNFGAQEFLLHQVLLFPHQMVYNKATHVWPVQTHNILIAELADVVTIHQDVVNIMLLIKTKEYEGSNFEKTVIQWPHKEQTWKNIIDIYCEKLVSFS